MVPKEARSDHSARLTDGECPFSGEPEIGSASCPERSFQRVLARGLHFESPAINNQCCSCATGY